MKKILNFEKDIKDKMSWIDVVKYYFEGISDKHADYMLWNQTCYPMDDEITLEQIYNNYKRTFKSIKKLTN